MRSVLLNIAVITAFFAGLWVGDMVGDSELDAGARMTGRLIAAVLGFFAAVGIAAIWADAADRRDFKDRLRRIRRKAKRK